MEFDSFLLILYMKNGRIAYEIIGDEAAVKRIIIGLDYNNVFEEFYVPEKISENGKDYYITEFKKHCFRFATCGMLIFSDSSRLRTFTDELFDNAYVQSIRIPPLLRKICDSAFVNVDHVTKIIVPDNNQYFTSISSILIQKYPLIPVFGSRIIRKVFIRETSIEIHAFAFQNCKNLRYVCLPKSLRIIGEKSFMNCVSLKRIRIPASVEEIRLGSFIMCINLERVTFEEDSKLKVICENVFQDCAALKSIKIPKNVIKICSHAFVDCFNLKSIEFETPSSIEDIANSAFSSLISLEKIFIPKSVKNLGQYNFFRCESLEDIIFDQNSQIHVIQTGFASFSTLKKLTLPPSVNYICKSNIRNMEEIVISNPGDVYIEDEINITNLKITIQEATQITSNLSPSRYHIERKANL